MLRIGRRLVIVARPALALLGAGYGRTSGELLAQPTRVRALVCIVSPSVVTARPAADISR